MAVYVCVCVSVFAKICTTKTKNHTTLKTDTEMALEISCDSPKTSNERHQRARDEVTLQATNLHVQITGPAVASGSGLEEAVKITLISTRERTDSRWDWCERFRTEIPSQRLINLVVLHSQPAKKKQTKKDVRPTHGKRKGAVLL